MWTITRIALALLALTAGALAQTASPNLADQQTLAADPTFQNRVRQALIVYCQVITSETVTGLTGTVPISYHIKRANFCASIMAAPDSFKQLFSDAAAINATILNEATQNGTVPLTGTNVAAQAAKILDPDLNNAVSSMFNQFLTVP